MGGSIARRYGDIGLRPPVDRTEWNIKNDIHRTETFRLCVRFS